MARMFKFYCIVCKTSFESDEWELSKYRGKNMYRVKTVHKCGCPCYRALKRSVARELKNGEM